MTVPKTFADVTDNVEWQRELAEIYGDVERVDLLVGTLAESTRRRVSASPTPLFASSSCSPPGE